MNDYDKCAKLIESINFLKRKREEILQLKLADKDKEIKKLKVQIEEHVKKLEKLESENLIPKEKLKNKTIENDLKIKKSDRYKKQDEEIIKDYILSKGGNLRGKYPKNVIRFLNKKQGKLFDLIEFKKSCGFKNRQSINIYIKKLIDWKLIKPTDNKNVYQNLFSKDKKLTNN